MSVKFYKGDIFTTKKQAIGHGVNTQGLMGAGIAKHVVSLYPHNYPPYKVACAKGLLQPGSTLPIQVTEDRWIMNMASQKMTGANASLEWLESSLIAALDFVREQGLNGLALPRIGAGIGGLVFEDVLEVIERQSAAYPDVEIEVWSL